MFRAPLILLFVGSLCSAGASAARTAPSSEGTGAAAPHQRHLRAHTRTRPRRRRAAFTPAPSSFYLATFDGARGTTRAWRTPNDRAVGGTSTGPFVVKIFAETLLLLLLLDRAGRRRA